MHVSSFPTGKRVLSLYRAYQPLSRANLSELAMKWKLSGQMGRNIRQPSRHWVQFMEMLLKPYKHNDSDQNDEARSEDSGPVQKSIKIPKPSGVISPEVLDESEDEELILSIGLVTLVAAVGYGNGIHGLARPEISVENFEDSWTTFEFTVAANKWDNGRDLVILPALLRGKLQDFYTTLNNDKTKDLAALMSVLSDRASLTKDPLASAKRFTEKKQDANKSARYFKADLRKLFKNKDMVSTWGRLTDRSKRSISGFSLAGQKSCDGNVYQLPRPYTGIDGEQTALRRLKD
ncbi:hypothetical protein EMCRGX_G030191 [Ephydatia muelleri]